MQDRGWARAWRLLRVVLSRMGIWRPTIRQRDKDVFWCPVCGRATYAWDGSYSERRCHWCSALLKEDGDEG